MIVGVMRRADGTIVGIMAQNPHVQWIYISSSEAKIPTRITTAQRLLLIVVAAPILLLVLHIGQVRRSGRGTRSAATMLASAIPLDFEFLDGPVILPLLRQWDAFGASMAASMSLRQSLLTAAHSSPPEVQPLPALQCG